LIPFDRTSQFEFFVSPLNVHLSQFGRDVSKLAAARMKDGRGIAGALGKNDKLAR
jgi:hypothetical protein